MTFDEVLAQVRELLQNKGRLAYPALKVRFGLDDSYLEALKTELIDAEQGAVDENGKVLVWIGGPSIASSQLSVAGSQSAVGSQQSNLPRPLPAIHRSI